MFNRFKPGDRVKFKRDYAPSPDVAFHQGDTFRVKRVGGRTVTIAWGENEIFGCNVHHSWLTV